MWWRIAASPAETTSTRPAGSFAKRRLPADRFHAFGNHRPSCAAGLCFLFRVSRMGWWIFDIFAIVAFAILLFLLILVLFEPGLRYEIKPRPLAIDSDEFLKLLGALCDAQVHGNTRVDVLKNGDHFYPAELAAIASARETIDL